MFSEFYGSLLKICKSRRPLQKLLILHPLLYNQQFVRDPNCLLPQKYLSMTTGHLNYSPIFELIIVTAIPFAEQQNPRVRDTGPSNSLQKSADLKKTIYST